MLKLFEFDVLIGRWRVLVHTKDLADKSVTREKLAPGVIDIDYSTMTPEDKDALAHSVLDNLIIASEDTCRAIVDELE